jgi:D-inositol-3-phosphate glycosyltransferase
LFAPGSKAAARQRLGWRDDEFVVLQLGRLVPRKGIDNVIQALGRLPRDWRVRLVVVGGDTREPDVRATPEIGRLQTLAREAGVEDRVTFTGHRRRAELPDFYVGADVFVTTPWYEPFGITPLEAMACGTPVIGSAVGGIRHTVADHITGYLVPPHDPEALALQLRGLYGNPLLARRLGQAGVQRVRRLFTWDRVADELLAVYRTLARPRRAAHRLRQVPAESGLARVASPMAGVGVAAGAGLQN